MTGGDSVPGARAEEQLEGRTEIGVPAPELILQVALVGKVNQARVIHKEHKSRRIDAGLSSVEELEPLSCLVWR